MVPGRKKKTKSAAGKPPPPPSADGEQRGGAQSEYERFFDDSLDMLAIAGFDGYFRKLSPAWERTLGCPGDHGKRLHGRT